MTSWRILRFPGADFAADDQGAFFVCENNVYRESRTIFHPNDTDLQAQ